MTCKQQTAQRSFALRPFFLGNLKMKMKNLIQKLSLAGSSLVFGSVKRLGLSMTWWVGQLSGS